MALREEEEREGKGEGACTRNNRKWRGGIKGLPKGGGTYVHVLMLLKERRGRGRGVRGVDVMKGNGKGSEGKG